MNIVLSKQWTDFLFETVDGGRYGSASEAVEEGLRLLADREARLTALRDKLNRSIAEGGDVSEEELDAALNAKAEELAREGF